MAPSLLVTTLEAEPARTRRRIELVRSVARYAGATGLVVGVWAGALAVSQHVAPDPALRDAALFLHLASLVAGMGAVLTLDWFALRWLLGHHELGDVMRLSGGVHTLVWIGLAGLTVSGAFLEPDLSGQWTRIKLAAVLVVALNGLHAHALQHTLERAERVTALLVLRAGLVAGLSQAGWWTAVVIGYLNSR